MLNEHHKSILPSSVMLVGSVAGDGMPEACRCWAPLPDAEGKTLRITVVGEHAARLLSQLKDNPNIAVTFADVRTMESFQLKGTVTAIEDATAEDEVRAEQHSRTFVEYCLAAGLPECVRKARYQPTNAIEITLERLYHQTPGPRAGSEIGGEA